MILADIFDGNSNTFQIRGAQRISTADLYIRPYGRWTVGSVRTAACRVGILSGWSAARLVQGLDPAGGGCDGR